MNKVIVFVLLMSMSFTLLSNEKIDFSDQDLAKEILLGKSWTCHLVDDHGKTDGHWTFSSLEGNKVKGSIVIDQYMACSSDVMTGKIKNNTLKYTGRVNHSSCSSFTGVMNFFRDDSGMVVADGVYTYGGLRFRGKYTCE